MIDTLRKMGGRMAELMHSVSSREEAERQENLAKHIAMLEDRVDEGQSLQFLKDSPHWPLFEAKLRERYEALKTALCHVPLKDVVRLQAQIAEIQFVLRIVPDGIAMGDAARKELDTRESL